MDNAFQLLAQNPTRSFAYNLIGSDSSNRIVLGDDTALVSNEIRFHSSGASTPTMLINTSGNVGIGTTTPNQRLSIYALSADAAINFGTAATSKKWSIGIDHSDGAKFKISSSSVLGTNDRLVIDGVGNIGIGTSTASQRLTVSASSTAGYAARIINTNNSVNADGLLISLGVANASRGTGNYFVGFSTLDGTVAGKIQGGASAVAYTTTAADLAEYFPVDASEEMPQAGEIVSLDQANDRNVKKATPDSVPFGIVTTNPGFVGNSAICKAKDSTCDKKYAQHNALISLVGQVPLKVSTENGAIKKGDSITISSVAGVGKKANFGDTAVGYALEDTDPNTLLDTVTVFANLHTALGMNPDPSLFVTADNPAGESDLTAKSIFEKMAQLVNGFVDGVLKVAGLRTNELCIDDNDGSTCIDRAQLKALLQEATQDDDNDNNDEEPIDDGGGDTGTTTDDGTEDGENIDDTSTSTQDGTENLDEDTETSTDDGTN